MSFNNNITPGIPPLIWSDVNDAFTKINENFDILAVAVGGVGGLVNFSSLDTNVSPTLDNTYSLGALGSNRWKSVFLSEYQDVPGNQANGVYIGSAQIRGRGSLIELPANSTVVGVPIKEPFFNAVQVDNNLRIEANTVAAPWGETVNLNSGTAMQLVVSSGADSITFNNTGVTALAASTGISVSGATGSITVANTGVISLTSTTALPSGRTAGAGININSAAGSGIKITNTGVLSVEAGSAALTISTDSATGIVTITNAAPAGNAFRYVVVDSDFGSPIEANSTNGSVNIVGGAGISLSKNTITDTLTVTVNPVFDLRGSVFGDDSTVMVNAIDRVITAAGGFIGNVTGNVTGDIKGSLFGDDSTAIINGIDNTVTGTTVTAGTIRLTGGTISTTDSSGIIVTAATAFNADVTLENDLIANNQVTVGGNLVVTRIAETATTLNIGRIGTTTTLNGNSVIANGSLTFSGNISAAAWTTSGIRHVSSPSILTDTTSSGTVANAYTNNFGGNTIAASNTVTYTNYGTMFVNTPTAGTNVTITNPYSIITASNILVGSTGTGVITAVAANATTSSTAASVGYIGLPQSATNTTATLAIGDVGKHIYVNTSGQTITIPAAASVAYPIGTTITFIAGPSASTVTIAIATDTMYLIGTGTTGSRTLAAHGMATAVKVSGTSSSGVWYINGSGLT